MGPTSETRRRPRRRLRLVVTLASPLVGFLVVELALRALIFGSSDLGAPFRDPGRYAEPGFDDDYWKLRCLFADQANVAPMAFDPLVGWLNNEIESGTYRHAEEELIQGRRPVLLYGASFARGGRRKKTRFESLLEKTDLSAEYRMLNYGIGGQGIDQAYLLMQKTLGRFPRETRPIVIIGLVIESDFDRCVLSFRDYPKPRLRLVDGRLRTEPVLPTAEHLERYPVSIRSYAWNHLLYGSKLIPDTLADRWKGRRHKLEAKRALIRSVILATQERLEQEGVDYFYLLFHIAQFLPYDGRVSSQERFVTGVFERHGVPYVCTRDAMLAFADAHGVDAEAFYRNADGHLNPKGNLAALDAICQGLRGEFTIAGALATER